MSLRRERERAELKRLRAYEALLALGATVLAAGLLAAVGLVVYGTLRSPRGADRPAPATDVSTLPAPPPAPPRP